MASRAAPQAVRGDAYLHSIKTQVNNALACSALFADKHCLGFTERLQHGFVDMGRGVAATWDNVVNESNNYEDSAECFEGREVLQ